MMLEYLSDLMEDAHDFSRVSAKGSHVVLLCKMEEGKSHLKDTHKIDLSFPCTTVFIAKSYSKFSEKVCIIKILYVMMFREVKTFPCNQNQKGSCQHKADHESDLFFLQICLFNVHDSG